jgi:hypothetical protein
LKPLSIQASWCGAQLGLLTGLIATQNAKEKHTLLNKQFKKATKCVICLYVAVVKNNI